MIHFKYRESAIEALLFTSSESITSKKLAEMLETDVASVETACKGLAARYEAAEAGIVLRQIAGGWRLYSSPEYHDLIEKYVLSLDTRKLSAAALETLAIVAYAQPVTRGGVAAARGVNSDYSINSLLEKGLVREAGTDPNQNGAVLYATTTTFLEHFGLNSLDDLPPLEDFAPDEKTRNFISERLSATKVNEDAMFDFAEDEDEGVAVGDSESDVDSDAKGDAESEKVVVDSHAGGEQIAVDNHQNKDANTLNETVASNKKTDKKDEKAIQDSNTKDDVDAQSLFATALSSALGATEKVDLTNIEIDTDN